MHGESGDRETRQLTRAESSDESGRDRWGIVGTKWVRKLILRRADAYLKQRWSISNFQWRTGWWSSKLWWQLPREQRVLRVCEGLDIDHQVIHVGRLRGRPITKSVGDRERSLGPYSPIRWFSASGEIFTVLCWLFLIFVRGAPVATHGRGILSVASSYTEASRGLPAIARLLVKK